VGSVLVQFGAVKRELISISVTPDPQDPKGAELELPTQLHFVVDGSTDMLQVLKADGFDGFDLGEVGALVGVVDLNSDGSDELLLEWRYAGGRKFLLATQNADGLTVVGSFAEGA
jgi:hypothetical protein